MHKILFVPQTCLWSASMEDIVTKLREYGLVYQNVKSDEVKSELIQSAAHQVLEGYAIVTKNILIGNIKLTTQEHNCLEPYKEVLINLGFKKQSQKARRQILEEGNLFQILSRIMAKLRV